MRGTDLTERPAPRSAEPAEKAGNPWRVVQFVLAAASAVPLLFWGGLNGWPWDSHSAPAKAPVVGAADPVRLELSRLKIDAPVDPVKTDPTTSAPIPPGFGRAGWDESSVEPGTVGRAVFEGHRTNETGGNDVFAGLSGAKAGDQIVVTTTGGKTVDFVVTSVGTYAPADVPMDQVFGSDGKTAQLRVIAPAGTASAGSYQQDVVVYANLAS